MPFYKKSKSLSLSYTVEQPDVGHKATADIEFVGQVNLLSGNGVDQLLNRGFLGNGFGDEILTDSLRFDRIIHPVFDGLGNAFWSIIGKFGGELRQECISAAQIVRGNDRNTAERIFSAGEHRTFDR